MEKTNNIFKVKIFRLLPLSIHNLYIYIYQLCMPLYENGK